MINKILFKLNKIYSERQKLLLKYVRYLGIINNCKNSDFPSVY